MLLVDTSVWIEVFRKESKQHLRDFADIEGVVTCLPVVQEVFLEAANLYRAGRRAGITIRSGVDCLIAVCALRHDLTVLHHERDFDLLSSVSALRSRSVTESDEVPRYAVASEPATAR